MSRNTLQVSSLLGFFSIVAFSGCGASQSMLAPSLSESGRSNYVKVCRDRAAKQSSDLSSGAYNPPILYVHTWTNHGEKLLPEAQLVNALESGELKNVLVVARGGLGKTKLAESLRAQMCDELPVFDVDLKEVAKLQGVQNPLLAVIAQEAGVEAPILLPELAAGRLLVLADGMEEVDLVQRAAVLAAIRDTTAKIPAAQFVLLVRPPILDADYGFTPVDAKMEIQPLECKTSEAFVARSYKDEQKRAEFERFLQRYNLDEKANFGVQCTYPYLSTYRDILTMADFQQKTMDPASGMIASRSNVYETLVGVRLKKELENLGWTQAEALDMVDRMVRVQVQKNGFREPIFDLQGCVQAIDARWGTLAVDAGVGGTPEERRRHVCEKTFQSALFAPEGIAGQFHFADRGTADLFLARWLNGELSRQNQLDCSLVVKQSELLATPAVLKFFVGQPLGQRCLMQVLDDRCTRDPQGEHVKALDEGLPIGVARKQALADAHALESMAKNKTCVMAGLKSLDATLSTP